MISIKTQFELVSNVPEIPVEFRSNDSKYKKTFILKFSKGWHNNIVSKI